MRPSKVICTAFSAALALALTAIPAFGQSDIAERRAEIDRMEREAIDTLFDEHPEARDLYDRAAGYAAFTTREIAAGIKAGGGHGVAVNKQTNERTYMNMSTGGLSLGLGGQKYDLVLLFQDRAKLNEFTRGDWQGDVGASAIAGRADATAEMRFSDGIAAFPLDERGLLLEADLSGTRFSVDEELNRGYERTEWRGESDYDPTRTKPGRSGEHRQYRDSHVSTPRPPVQQ